MRWLSSASAGSLLLAVCLPAAQAATPDGAARFVAGLAPQQRPAAAPTLRDFNPGPSWRARALSGVSQPVPASLSFLDDQGAWYTPFTQPGMTGYYDLRGWHGEPINPKK